MADKRLVLLDFKYMDGNGEHTLSLTELLKINSDVEEILKKIPEEQRNGNIRIKAIGNAWQTDNVAIAYDAYCCGELPPTEENSKVYYHFRTHPLELVSESKL